MKVVNFPLYFAIFLIFTFDFCFSQSEIRTNKGIVINFINEFADTLSKQIDTTKNKIILIGTTNNALNEYLENIVVSRLNDSGFKFFLKSCDTCRKLQISVNKFAIDYKRIRREKPTNLIVRTIELELIALIKDPETFIKSITYPKTYRDTISTDNFDFVEQDGAPFTAPKPKEPENFLKKYFEPIAIIGSTALAILLFFTVRSK